jgi:hypothetical protein
MKQTALLLLLSGCMSFAPLSATGRTFVVVGGSDTHDANPGDGTCSDLSGQCSLRAAIEEANAGAFDTVIVADSVESIYLTLGPLVVTGPDMVIAGENRPAVIDGRYNPENADNIELRGDRCRIYSCVVAHARRNGALVAAADVAIGRAGYRTIFVGNGLNDPNSSAIAITGRKSAGTTVAACWIGLKGNGTVTEANQNGIRVCGADRITIGSSSPVERNLISGNNGYGVLLDSAATGVRIVGNYVGLDVTGKVALPNAGDGVRIVGGSRSNQVGGTSTGERNLISANLGCGIRLEGFGTDSNQIGGNFVGLDSAGYLMLGNHVAGVRVADGASHNMIGNFADGHGLRLVVSGNFQNGIEIVGHGTDSNAVDWSWVGLDGKGNSDRPNGLDQGQGILIGNGARFNTVGSDMGVVCNIISGNYGPGVSVVGFGTDYNVIAGNYIGPSRFGTGAIGNSAGVVIRDSARYNAVGGAHFGNLLSGNRWELFPLGAGVVIFGRETKFYWVRNNFIGTDYTGTVAVRNGSAGIIIGGGASENLIGGDTSIGNLISGNGFPPLLAGLAAGIHLFGPGTDSNVIAGNLIGVAADGQTPIPNTGHGIGLFGGARWTTIGGADPSMKNIIGRNKYAGIWIDGDSTYGHLVRFNSMFNNDSTGVALRHGGNRQIGAPIILEVVSDSVFGSHPIPGTIVDIYTGKTASNEHIEGVSCLASGVVNISGAFAIHVSGIQPGDTLTTVASVVGVGSSEFGSAMGVPVPTGTNELEELLPSEVTLHQNEPNPFNPTTLILFYLPSQTKAALEIFNVIGERVTTVASGAFPAGHHSVAWDGRTAGGTPAASGVYFYRLTAGAVSITKKMLLLK